MQIVVSATASIIFLLANGTSKKGIEFEQADDAGYSNKPAWRFGVTMSADYASCIIQSESPNQSTVTDHLVENIHYSHRLTRVISRIILFPIGQSDSFV